MSILGALGSSLYSTITGGSNLVVGTIGTVEIYSKQAPEGSALPYVVYSLQSGVLENIYSGRLENCLAWVRSYSKIETDAWAIDAAVEAKLHGQTLSIAGYTNLWTMRESNIDLVENLPNGEIVYTAGGMYRIRADG